MKASVKLRAQASDNPSAPPFLPLLRLKLPVTVLGFPFLSSASLGPAPSDPALRLRTLLPHGPSLVLSYHPGDRDAVPSASFSITLTCGLGPLASPLRSPISLSAHLPLLPGASPRLSLRLSARLGDFSLKRSLPLSPAPRAHPKENGAGVYRPLPVGAAPWPAAVAAPDLHWTLVDSGIGARTSVPVLDRAAVTVRWGVRLPQDVGGAGIVGPPFLVVDKISVERTPAADRKVVPDDEGSSGGTEGKGSEPPWWWVGREAEELRREQESIRRGIEEIRARIGKKS